MWHEKPAPPVKRLASIAMTEVGVHYVGMDYCVDLECETCRQSTRIRYSRLLGLVTKGVRIACADCGRMTGHDWTSASAARRLFREQFSRFAPSSRAGCG
jgi:hypothetical protein